MTSTLYIVGVGDTDASFELKKGLTVLGRNLRELNCTDKKVSREHATIELDKDGKVWLKAEHVNPCFLYEESGETRPLKKGERECLNEGDKFSLLPGQFIYKISAISEDKSEDGSEDFEDGPSESSDSDDDSDVDEEETPKKSSAKKSRKAVKQQKPLKEFVVSSSEDEAELEPDDSEDDDFDPESDSDYEDKRRGKKSSSSSKKKKRVTSDEDDDSDEDFGKPKTKKKSASVSKKPRPASSRRQPTRGTASKRYQEPDSDDDDY